DAAAACAAGAAILAAGSAALFEEYLTGPLVSVEVFRKAGRSLVLGVTDRVLSDPPYFAELSWTFPLHLPAGVRAELESAADAVLTAIGFDDGPAHVEFVLGPTGPKVVEVNPRMAGRGVTQLVNALSGYDEYELTIRAALGLALPEPGPKPPGFLSEWVVTAPADAPVTAEIAAAATSLPGVLGARLALHTPRTHAHGDRYDVGEVRAYGVSANEAQMCARAGAHAVMAAIAAAAQPEGTPQ
ncbi:MAG: ATP-grasp domain-containing protein, partial [Mycobacteriaceae bacterium]|nr:ATP-grasp domain-containing protein [Mycobacteriaceae bacterium]